MQKSALGIFFALALLAACSKDSSNKPSGETKRSTTVVRRSIPRSTHEKAQVKTAKRLTGKASQFVYAKSACNIRRGPGTGYPIARKANKGEKLEYISREGNWFRLKVGKGKRQEWVHRNVVVVPKNPVS